jgi:hypothetical protein
MSDCKEIEAYARKISELESLGRKLTAVIEDFMPNIGKCVINIGQLNDALMESARLLGPPESKKKK